MNYAAKIEREKAAASVHELTDKAIQLETIQARNDAEDAEKLFYKKYKMDWKHCIPKQKGRNL